MAPRGIRVDGYGGDPAASDGVLSLIIADFNQTQEITTLTATDMNATFRRLSNFLERSLDEGVSQQLGGVGTGIRPCRPHLGAMALRIQGAPVSDKQQSAQLTDRRSGGP